MKTAVVEFFFIKLQAFKPENSHDQRKTPQKKLSSEFFQDHFSAELLWTAASGSL